MRTSTDAPCDRWKETKRQILAQRKFARFLVVTKAPCANHRCTFFLLHGAIKRRIRSMLGFKSAKTAYATLKGIEAMRMIRKLQCILLQPGVADEVRFFNKLFGVYA